LALPVASPEEQETIVAILRAGDDRVAALEREAGLLDEFFRALLEELMTDQRSAARLIEAARPDG